MEHVNPIEIKKGLSINAYPEQNQITFISNAFLTCVLILSFHLRLVLSKVSFVQVYLLKFWRPLISSILAI